MDWPVSTTTHAYDNANNVFTVVYPNGVTTTYGYDQLNRVSGLGYTTQTGVYAYGRDNTGKLTSASEPSGRSVTWNYDGINRLTNESIAEANGTNYAASYSLDPVGNRSSESSSIPSVPSGSWSFNADDELSDEGYDANGNVTSASGKSFTYDSENHLVSMGATVGLQYDGDGNRAAKSVSGTVTRYLVDDLNPTGYPQVVEELTNGVASRTYTYGLERISEYQPISNVWTPGFYGYDGGGNVRQLMSSTGAVTDSYEYDAYGNSFTVSGSTPNEFMYRGEQYDSDLGLYYLRARYYNPATGRFMSRDPFVGHLDDPATLHRYLYSGGDPVNWVDPSGRDFMELALPFGRIDIPATAGLIAERAAIVCVFNLAASELVEAANHMDITGINWPTCSARATVPPYYGPPNGHIDGPRRGRDFGPNGEPSRDYDKPHQGAPYPHVHEWPGGQREHPGRPYSPWPPEGGSGENPPTEEPQSEETK